MNKNEFLNQLEALLADISPTEKEEAMQYYREYFDDAGVENEADVIRQLGSPSEVAQTIKEGLAGRELSVVSPKSGEERSQQRQAYSDAGAQTGTDGTSDANAPVHSGDKKKMDPVVFAILLVVGCFVGVTVGIPVISTLCGIVVGIAGAIFGLLCGVFFGGVGLIVAGVGVMIGAVATLFVSPLTALLLVGIALVLGAVGLVLTLLGVEICVHGFPILKDGIVRLYDWVTGLFEKNRQR